MSILDDSLTHLEQNRSAHPQKKGGKSPSVKNPFVLGAFGLVAAFAVFVSVKLAQNTQDVRNKAVSDQGVVLISSTASPATLTSGQPVTITLQANTQDTQIDGIQLTFTVDGSQVQGFAAAPVVTLLPGTGLGLITPPSVTNVQADVYQIVFSVGRVPDPLTGVLPPPFSSSTPTDYAKITFTPNNAGTVAFQFDNTTGVAATSKAALSGSTNGDDVLHAIADMNFTIAALPTDVPTETPTGTLDPTPTVTPSNTPTRTPTPSVTGGITMIPGQTITPTATLFGDPPQSPSPTITIAAGTCNTIEMRYVSTGQLVTAPRQGDAVNFTCGQINGAARYEFQIKTPGSIVFSPLNPVAAGSRISEQFTISQGGDYSGQCRMCTGATEDTCQAWE